MKRQITFGSALLALLFWCSAPGATAQDQPAGGSRGQPQVPGRGDPHGGVPSRGPARGDQGKGEKTKGEKAKGEKGDKAKGAKGKDDKAKPAHPVVPGGRGQPAVPGSNGRGPRVPPPTDKGQARGTDRPAGTPPGAEAPASRPAAGGETDRAGGADAPAGKDERARDGQPARDGAGGGTTPAERLAGIETQHAVRMARIDRLMEVYRAEGNQEKLAETEQLRARQRSIHERALASLEKDVGPEEFRAARASLGGQRPDAAREGAGDRVKQAQGEQEQRSEAARQEQLRKQEELERQKREQAQRGGGDSRPAGKPTDKPADQPRGGGARDGGGL